MDLRQYDPAIARWTAIDPVTHFSQSTYNGFDNNPIFWSDPSGADGEHYNWKTKRYENDKGEEVSFEETLASQEGSPQDHIKINTKTKQAEVFADDNDYDTIETDGEISYSPKGNTESRLKEEGYSIKHTEGVGMGAVDNAALILAGEAVFAWVGRGISAWWAARGSTNLITNAVWAQKTFSATFSAGGRFAGRTVDDVATALRSGEMSISEVTIDLVVRNGQSLILNTRSSAALTRAGIPRSQWNVINRTGQEFFENQLTNQLTRNGLNSAGTSTIRQSGTKNVIGL